MTERPVPDDEAFNQSPPFVDVNLFTSDTALRPTKADPLSGMALHKEACVKVYPA